MPVLRLTQPSRASSMNMTIFSFRPSRHPPRPIVDDMVDLKHDSNDSVPRKSSQSNSWSVDDRLFFATAPSYSPHEVMG